jgi:hypothetical protein
MKLTDIIIFIGFGMTLVWSGLYTGTEGKKKTYLIWAGVIIDIILWAVSRNLIALFGGILMGIAVGSLIEGFNVLFRKMGIRGREKYIMQGWKNWVISSVITTVMMLSTISIVAMIQ